MQVKNMGDLSDVTEFIDFKTFSKVLFYHIVRFCILGPFTWPFVALFSGWQYATNLGFGFNRLLLRFTVFESFQWALFVIPAIILVYEKIALGAIKQDIYPMILLILHIVLRAIVIAIRHATTPPRLYREYYQHPLTIEMLTDGLMFLAWAEINEDQLTLEISKTMLKNEINPKFFTFKVLLPVYPPMRKYLMDDRAYET